MTFLDVHKGKETRKWKVKSQSGKRASWEIQSTKKYEKSNGVWITKAIRSRAYL